MPVKVMLHKEGNGLQPLEYVGAPVSGQGLKDFIRERVPGVAEIELLSDAAQRRRASSASPLFSPGDTG